MSGPEEQIFVTRHLLESGIENLDVTEDPTWTATMKMPRLGYESTDRDGRTRINSIMLLSNLARLYAVTIPNDEYGSIFLDWNTVVKEVFTFLTVSEMTVDRRFYDQNLGKKSLSAKIQLGHVGNSTVTCLTWLYAPGIKEAVVQETNSVAAVDQKTRKVTAFPEWFKKRFKGTGATNSQMVVVPLERPNKTFVYIIKVGWSDTDNYTHTNFASYAKFAVDGIHAALLDIMTKGEKAETEGEKTLDGCDNSTVLKGLTENIVKNGIKNMKVIYLSETFEGYVLDAHIWQEQGNPHVVKCAIESNHKEICHLTIEYYENK